MSNNTNINNQNNNNQNNQNNNSTDRIVVGRPGCVRACEYMREGYGI